MELLTAIKTGPCSGQHSDAEILSSNIFFGRQRCFVTRKKKVIDTVFPNDNEHLCPEKVHLFSLNLYRI